MSVTPFVLYFLPLVFPLPTLFLPFCIFVWPLSFPVFPLSGVCSVFILRHLPSIAADRTTHHCVYEAFVSCESLLLPM